MPCHVQKQARVNVILYTDFRLGKRTLCKYTSWLVVELNNMLDSSVHFEFICLYLPPILPKFWSSCIAYRGLHSHTEHPKKVTCFTSMAISCLFKMENVIKFLNNSRVEATIQCPFWGSLWCKWKNKAIVSVRVDLRFTM